MEEKPGETLTVGGRYGRVGVKILRGSDCVAVVGRMQANRLAHLDTVRSANAKRGEQAHFAEAEAQEIERFEALDLALQFAASGELLMACKLAEQDDDDQPISGETRRALLAAIAKAEGRP